MRSLVFVAFAISHPVFLTVCAGTDVSNGFNSNIKWQSPAVLKDLGANDKPIMFLFNQPWCGACNRLKENFKAEGDQLLEVAEKFLMINVGGDDNNGFDATYAPDGGYIPRVLFADPSGKLRTDIKNPAAQEQYAYFYQSVEQVKTGMENALKLLASSKGAATQDTSEL